MFWSSCFGFGFFLRLRCVISVVFGMAFFQVTLCLVGWQQEKLKKIENGGKKIEEDIEQNRIIEQNVFSFRKRGIVFRFSFFVKSSFLFRRKAGEKKRFFVLGKKKVFGCDSLSFGLLPG